VLAGHNGSGKSTLWHRSLADEMQVPLVNADRMMVSILPEVNSEGALPPWAADLRDTDESWMRVAQKGVQAFVGHAMNAKVPFAMETVFSHWVEREDGTFESKVDRIRDMQDAGYFVLLVFVGLASVELSVSRVATRVIEHGHGVAEAKLRERFPRTQKAVAAALKVADASLATKHSTSDVARDLRRRRSSRDG
jgi:predicted ABC-type ATPase